MYADCLMPCEKRCTATDVRWLQGMQEVEKEVAKPVAAAKPAEPAETPAAPAAKPAAKKIDLTDE